MKPKLIIDFDGTLCHDKFWRGLHDESVKIQDFLFRRNSTLVEEWMVGQHTSEKINEYVARGCHIPYEKLWDVFVADCRTMSIGAGVLEKVANLQKQYETILCTDNMDCFHRFTVPALHLGKYFHRILSSFRERKLKRGILPELVRPSTILVDDSQAACELVRELGGTAFHIVPGFDLEHYLVQIAAQT